MALIGNNHCSDMAQFRKATLEFPTAPRALCFGDSWLQYPPLGTDIDKQLARRFRGTLFLGEGVPGRDSVQWKIAMPRIQREIGAFAFAAIILSIGGNDVLGDELDEYLKTPEQPQLAGSIALGEVPREVFDHVRLAAFEHALGYAINDFTSIVQCRDALSPASVIVAHTYDYIYPDDSPFELGPITVGPWAKPALDRVGLTDPRSQRIVTNWLLDQFARAVKSFASQVRDMRIVDSRGTLTSKRQWENEIHPTASGFARITKTCWAPTLCDLLR